MHTPHISKLQSESVSFNFTYCASPICVPSRGAFFTGKYPNNNGSLINGWVGADEKYREVKSGLPTLYTVMEKQWDSWHVGKQHLFTVDKIDENPNSISPDRRPSIAFPSQRKKYPDQQRQDR